MVKKILSVFALGLMTLGAQAQYQFPNSDFEENFISSYGSYTEPRGWHGYASIADVSPGSMGRSGEKLVQVNDPRPGSAGTKSVYVKSTAILGVKANGVMTNGQIVAGDTKATNGQKNYNYAEPGSVLSASTWGANNQFYTPFTGRPDAMKVWLKYVPAASGFRARVSIYTYTEGTMYDPTDNADMDIVVGHAEKAVGRTNEWYEETLPFIYSRPDAPAYILATFTTSETPGQGGDGDQLYIDDIEMVYYSTMINPTYNGTAINFDANGCATIPALYSEKMLKYTTGVAATVDTSMDENFQLTIKIDGNDLSVNPNNTHTYKIQFTGIASGNDDEKSAVVAPETVAPACTTFSETGTYYLYNSAQQTYLAHGNTLTMAPVQTWTFTASNGITDNDGHTLKIQRPGDYGKKEYVDYSIFEIHSDGVGNNDEIVKKTTFTDGVLRMYRESVKAYQKPVTAFGITTWWDQTADIYVGASSQTALVACSASDDNGKWLLHSLKDVNRIHGANGFWHTHTSATTSNGIDASDFVEDGTTTTLLPLGIYQITGSGKMTVGETEYTSASGKFYLPNGSEVTFTGTPTLTYYGRLDFDLNATYNGTAVTSGQQVNDVYLRNRLNVTLGNGAQDWGVDYDENTNELTISISGYGRQREHNLKFQAPDLGLHAKWYGNTVEDGQQIDEEYVEDKLVVTPGRGADTAEVSDYNPTSGLATITVSGFGKTKTYTLQFLAPVAADGNELVFNTARLFKQKLNGTDYTQTSPTIRIQPLVDGNINFTLQGTPSAVGTVVAKNIKLDKHGNFTFADNVRLGDKLVPFVVNGTLKDGQLQAVADVCIPQSGNQYTSYHVSYNLAGVQSSATFTHDLVVTVNGEVSTAKNQAVRVEYLADGNINFSLQNFELSLTGNVADAGCVGDIFLENLQMDKDGFFTYESGLLIGASAGVTDCLGPTLGVVPVKLHGEIFNKGAGKDMILTIDIAMESINQTISVYFAAAPQNTISYTDLMVVNINGTAIQLDELQTVEVEELKNGSINFCLKNFQMPLGGTMAYIGNVKIANIPMDEQGNFEYNGIIRIGRGDLAGVLSSEWGGPELGDVPVKLRGQMYESEDPTGDDEATALMAVIDIRMASLDQTIHVTYGIDIDRNADDMSIVDELAVSVNGEVTVQPDVAVNLFLFENGRINFVLNDFILEADGNVLPIGNIAVDALTLDEDLKFHYDGTIRIGAGSADALPEGVEWAGNALGDVPLVLNGKIVPDEDDEKLPHLIVAIDINMEETIGQTINVVYGGKVGQTKLFTDRLDVTVNGEVNSVPEAQVTVGYLQHDPSFINFTLKNFCMDIDGSPMYLGNIAINALELDENACFTYHGAIRIGDGDAAVLPAGAQWSGGALGAIPMDMKGQIYAVGNTEYLIASIDIDMEDAIGQTISVAFGATPVSTDDYIGDLLVTINSQDYNQPRTDIEVGALRNGNINFTLKNFALTLNGAAAYVGNIQLQNMELDADGNFSYNGNVRIGKGDVPGVDSWLGTELGVVPLELTGKLVDGKLQVAIDIDMRDTSLKQLIGVRFGYALNGADAPVKCYNLNRQDLNEKIEAADLTRVIKSILDRETKYEAGDIEKALDIILKR